MPSTGGQTPLNRTGTKKGRDRRAHFGVSVSRTGAPPTGSAPALAYFWMQVSAVSLVHSSRPVNTGSSTFSPLIRLIITDGAL